MPTRSTVQESPTFTQHRCARLTAVISALTLIAACRSDRTMRSEPGGPRVLAIYANDANNAFQTGLALDLVHSVGVRGAVLSAGWDALEPQPGSFELASLDTFLREASDGRRMTVFMSISLISTVSKHVPPDLMSIPFNADRMKVRFHAFIDAMAPIIRGRVTYLAIGNEVDFYLSNLQPPGAWAAYESFYSDAVGYVHRVLPGIKVGVAITYRGASGSDRALARSLNRYSDVAIYTYYPINAAGHITNPEDVSTVLPDMVTLANGRPVLVQEIGFTTTPSKGGSEQGQADFIRRVFAAWRSIDPDKMPFLVWIQLHDFPRATCEALAVFYGAPGIEEEIDNLCSLGIRRVDGSPKSGWNAFVQDAADFGRP